MLRSSLPTTPRDIVESITSVVRPNRWAFEKCIELVLALRRRSADTDYNGRRTDTSDERLIRRLFDDIRNAMPALSSDGLAGARTHLTSAFQHCQHDRMLKAAAEFALARLAALVASGCLPEPEDTHVGIIDTMASSTSKKTTQGVRIVDLEGRIEAIRIACVSAIYEHDHDLDMALDLVSSYVTWLLLDPAIHALFQVYLNPTKPDCETIAGLCVDRKRLLAVVCHTNLVLQSFFMKMEMADSLDNWPTLGLKHMKHFYM